MIVLGSKQPKASNDNTSTSKEIIELTGTSDIGITGKQNAEFRKYSDFVIKGKFSFYFTLFGKFSKAI